MALKRMTISGYGQLELNQVSFRRDGNIEAQCKLDETDFATFPAENGMLLAVDKANGKIKLYNSEKGHLPIALNYTSEHMYEQRANGLKDFKLEPGSFLPRLGYLKTGDIFTTNCVAYDDTEFNTEEALMTALESAGTTSVFGTVCANGAIKLTKTPGAGIQTLQVVKKTTMPDGQIGVKFIAIPTLQQGILG